MIRRSWMTGASIETTLALWASSLREVKKRMRPLFEQDRTALNAGLFVDGLLGDERRKTGWMRAEAAGDPGPWRQQAVLGRGRWDADTNARRWGRGSCHRRDRFFEQGEASCGVARQYTGLGGKNHLPDRRVRLLCIVPRPCLHRPEALSAKSVDGRSRTHGGGTCARRCLVCHETPNRAGDRREDTESRPSLICHGAGPVHRSYWP